MRAVLMDAMGGYTDPVHQVSKTDARKAAEAYTKALGLRVKAWRLHLNVSAEALARHADLSVDTVRSLEGGRMKASMAVLHALALAMGIDLEQLMFAKPPKG